MLFLKVPLLGLGSLASFAIKAPPHPLFSISFGGGDDKLHLDFQLWKASAFKGST